MTRNPETFRRTPRSMLGMSLVEIMVATAVGLIGVTMIMQVYAVAEGQKRTTTGASDAQISGNIAQFSIERELRLAGFGMITNAGNMLGCNTLAFDSTRLAAQNFNFVMAPVVITVGAGGTSDTIQVIYGNALNIVEGSPFSGGAPSAAADFPLKNAAGFLVGTRVVAFESGQNCLLAEVTGFVPAAVNTIQHGAGDPYTYTDAIGNPVTVNARHNNAVGAVSYTTSAQLYALGRNPVVKTFLVAGDKLVTQSDLPYVAAEDTMLADGVSAGSDGRSDAEIASGIVQLKAVYGKDTGTDGIVNLWDTALPTNAAEWMQVRAVKIAILARSGLFEKNAVTASGAGTAPAPAWRDPGTGALTPFVMANLADGTDWRNYRYRVYETTVPLRNMIWSNDP